MCAFLFCRDSVAANAAGGRVSSRRRSGSSGRGCAGSSRWDCPAASQVTLEVGVFAAATALAGRLAPAALAAHQIAINIASCTFMVPLGVASAGAVRVGHAVGRRDVPAAARGLDGAAVRRLVHGVRGAAVRPRPPRADRRVHDRRRRAAIGTSLLFVAAVFQLFDGIQGVATGVLRGLGDTRTPMLWNLAAHWFIGLPLGYTLCFVIGIGVIGLWWGLSTGLIICGVALSIVWTRRIGALKHAVVGQP